MAFSFMGKGRCASSRVTTGLVDANDFRFHATQRLGSDFPVLREDAKSTYWSRGYVALTPKIPAASLTRIDCGVLAASCKHKVWTWHDDQRVISRDRLTASGLKQEGIKRRARKIKSRHGKSRDRHRGLVESSSGLACICLGASGDTSERRDHEVSRLRMMTSHCQKEALCSQASNSLFILKLIILMASSRFSCVLEG